MLTATCYLGRTYIVCTARNVFMFIRRSHSCRSFDVILAARCWQSDLSIVRCHAFTQCNGGSDMRCCPDMACS